MFLDLEWKPERPEETLTDTLGENMPILHRKDRTGTAQYSNQMQDLLAVSQIMLMRENVIAMMRSPRKLYLWFRTLTIFLCSLMAFGGILLIGIAVWLVCGATVFVNVLATQSEQLNISCFCFGIGAGLIFTSFIGSWGAWKENDRYLTVFFLIASALFIANAMGFFLFVGYGGEMDKVVLEAGTRTLKEMYMGPAAADPISTAWNTVMSKFKCCGIENSTLDFSDSVYHMMTGLNYPITCCINKTLPACDGIQIEPNLIQPESCYGKLLAVIKENSIVLGAVAGSMCLLELALTKLCLKLDTIEEDTEYYY